MYVVNFVNSFIGRAGNIGQRTEHILNYLQSQHIHHKSVSRGFNGKVPTKNINMSVLGHLPRLLNAFRIYCNMNFNHRIWDITLFEVFVRTTRWFWNDKTQVTRKIGHIWEYSPKIMRTLKEKGYTIVLDVPMAPTVTSRKILAKFGATINLHPHDTIEQLERVCFALADVILTPSEFVRDELLSIGVPKNKVSVIPFGADQVGLRPPHPAREYQHGVSLNYCFAGNISTRKGIETLLAAWDSPIFERDTLHLCGRLYPDMIKRLNEYKFKNIQTPGFVDIKRYFERCDIYVFPSFLEGSSKSVYQAMAAGLPCIVTPNAGSIIRSGTDGFIIPPGDVTELRAAMARFKEQPQLIRNMGSSSSALVKNFTWKRYSQSVVEIYKDIAAGKLPAIESQT